MLITDIIERQKDNEKTVIKFRDNAITYKELYLFSISTAKKISSLFGSTLNVVTFLPNSIDYAKAYFSILFAKKVIVPIGLQSKNIEILSTIEYCEADLVIANNESYQYLKETLQNYKYKIAILRIDTGEVEYLNEDKSAIEKSDAIVNNGPDNDVAIMLHTSGTTSMPKRVMLTHHSLLFNVRSNIESLKLTENDKVLISMPMHFGYCNTAQFLTHLYLGASMVIYDGMFLPDKFFSYIQDEKITNFTGVPTMLIMLEMFNGIDKYDISSLRYICFGGGRMPVGILQKLIEKYPTIGFVQTYGQTEASPRVTALLPEDSLRKIGSVGLAIPNETVRVVDDNMNEVGANVTGEIIVQGENIMKGYYKRDEITESVLVDNWLKTGDLGHKDEEGYLYITGRKKNMLISGGINIYPEEIEEILIQHPNIKDVYVYGEEDKFLGEVPVAKIILNSPDEKDDFYKYCSSRMADYKIPLRFYVVDEIGKTYNGKVKRYDD